MTADEVVEYLSSCNAADLIDIIARSVYTKPSGIRNGIEERVVLCMAYSELQPVEPYADGKWNFEVVAMPVSMSESQLSRSQGYWEGGDCPTCKVPVVSYAKSVTCPLCGSPVPLT
jgi:hypothetical protein